MKNKCFTMIIFGLSGSGKTTLAEKIHEKLNVNNLSVEVLDADVYRAHLSPNASYSENDRNQFRKKLFFVSSLLNKHSISTIIPMISSDSSTRKFARKEISNLHEIYLSTPIEACIRRDPKGLYKKVRGKFKENIVGIDIPFKKPDNPDLTLNTDNHSVKESVEIIMNFLDKKQEI